MHIKQEMIDFVIGLLKEKIPDSFYYHNVEHTLYVMHNVVEIGKAEKCTEEEMELLKAAALWHDVGYINIYMGHEEESCRLCKIHLPNFGYTADEIEIICGMIMATKIPHDPETKLEEIIADADLLYLGTDQAAYLANNLFKELNRLNPQLTQDSWNKTEISFLKTHNFFTPYCRQNYEPGKLNYFNKLITKNG